MEFVEFVNSDTLPSGGGQPSLVDEARELVTALPTDIAERAMALARDGQDIMATTLIANATGAELEVARLAVSLLRSTG